VLDGGTPAKVIKDAFGSGMKGGDLLGKLPLKSGERLGCVRGLGDGSLQKRQTKTLPGGISRVFFYADERGKQVKGCSESRREDVRFSLGFQRGKLGALLCYEEEQKGQNVTMRERGRINRYRSSKGGGGKNEKNGEGKEKKKTTIVLQKNRTSTREEVAQSPMNGLERKTKRERGSEGEEGKREQSGTHQKDHG